MSKILHVLLTGGVGSRLWPLSRQSKPKQYLKLFSEAVPNGSVNKPENQRNLFELAVQRNAAFADGLVVVGNKGNRELSSESLKDLGFEKYVDIVEATPRNTAPAIAFAAFAAQPEDVLLVTPADHIIKEGPEYSMAVSKALELAKKDNIVTFGIRPTRPETGYGYIEADGEEVLAFREKPDAATAEDFLKQGNFLWNSGMFCFKAGVFLEELKKYEPEVYRRSLIAWTNNQEGIMELETSLEIPAISVDYAVMENSDRIKVVSSGFDWSDMGSFEAVYDYLKENGHPVDENGNMFLGDDKYTAFVGLQNCIMVSTPNANLVLSKYSSQGVKDIYRELEMNRKELVL